MIKEGLVRDYPGKLNAYKSMSPGMHSCVLRELAEVTAECSLPSLKSDAEWEKYLGTWEDNQYHSSLQKRQERGARKLQVS